MQEDNRSTVIKKIFNDITNLQEIIDETKCVSKLLEAADGVASDEVLEDTKRIVVSLKKSVDQISGYLDENFKTPVEEIDVKPTIGAIKLVDLSKLIDHRLQSSASNNDIVILSDSDSDTPEPKTPKKKRLLNNNKEDDRASRSILKNRLNGTDSSTTNSPSNKDKPLTPKKVQFADKDGNILSQITDSESSPSSNSSDSDEAMISHKKSRKAKSKFNVEATLGKFDDAKFGRKCFIKVNRVPAERLKADYMRKMEQAEIKRLLNMKTLKRSRKHDVDSSSDLSDSSKPAKKKVADLDSGIGREGSEKATKSDDSDDKTPPTDSTDVLDASNAPTVGEAENPSLDEEPKDHTENKEEEKEKKKIDDEEISKNDKDDQSFDMSDSFDKEASKKKSDENKVVSDSEGNDNDALAPADTSNLPEEEDFDKLTLDCIQPSDNEAEDKSDKDEESSEDSDKQVKKKKANKNKEKSNDTGDDSENEEKKKKEKSNDTEDGSDNDDKKEKNDDSKSNDTEDDNDDKKKEGGKDKLANGDKTSSEESGSDEDKPKKKQSAWKRDKLLTQKLSDSDSEDQESFKKKLEKLKAKEEKSSGKKKPKFVISDSDDSSKEKEKSSSESESEKESSSSTSDSDAKAKENEKKKARRRIKKVKDSSDEDDDKSTRKHIRKVLNRDSLAETTKQAEKDESERKARILDRQKKYNDIFEADKLEKSSVSKVVLDFNEETEEELLCVDKDLVKHLKPHQAKGIQFMWDACFESIDRAKSTEGSGCILAHCMGLGKTLQVISLVHTLLKASEKTGVHRVMVVCPLSTVLNWVSEFKKWLPDEEDLEVFELVTFKQNRVRAYQCLEWNRVGGVLILGYDMFRNLSNDKSKRCTKKMRNDFQRCLVDPGPDMVVCDEGHLLKNEKTSLSQSMNRLKTARRIVLTGTPLQNNLREYWCMVQFVKPNLLGTFKEYLNRFVNPITNGQYTDSTQHDIGIMRKRSHVLHKLLDGIVQRRDYCVLAPFLPPKYEYVLFISLTETQVKLYSHYMRELARQPTGGKNTFLFIDFQELQRICTHPRVLLDKSLKNKLAKEKRDWENEDDESEGSLKDFIDDGSDGASTPADSSDDDDDESDKPAKAEPPRRRTRAMAEANGSEVEEDVVEEVASAPPEWWSQYTSGDELDNILHSGKLHLLFEILHQCELMGDKVLVFSQSLFSLNVIEYFLSKIDEASQNDDTSMVGGYSGSWALGLDYFRLDGSSSCDNRALWCKTFNDPANTRARVFLISTRAGGLGINLVAANRVIIFDVSWNPSHDIQSIYRVYRFGQIKPSYIYRFVTLGTMEMKIYERQVTKQAISKRVIDEQQIDRHYNQNDLAELYKFEPVPEGARPTPLVPKDILLGELIQKHENLIYSYHEHQTLLENKEDEVLDEAERKAAWEEFENEKKNRHTVNHMNNINNIPMSTIINAITSIMKREQPTFTPAEINGVMPQLVQELQSQIAIGDMTMYHKIVKEIRLIQSQNNHMQDLYRYQQQQQMMLLEKYKQQFGNIGANPDAARVMQEWQQRMQNMNASNSMPGNSRRAAGNIEPMEVVRIDD